MLPGVGRVLPEPGRYAGCRNVAVNLTGGEWVSRVFVSFSRNQAKLTGVWCIVLCVGTPCIVADVWCCSVRYL